MLVRSRLVRKSEKFVPVPAWKVTPFTGGLIPSRSSDLNGQGHPPLQGEKD